MKRIVSGFIFELLTLLILIVPVFGQKPHPASGLEFNNLKVYTTRSTDSGKIVEETGYYRYLYNESARGYAGTAEDIARAYLSDQSERFGVDKDTKSLKLFKLSRTPGGSHVFFDQVIKGVPVYASRMVVTINNLDEVTFVASEFRPDLKLNNYQPLISAEIALSVARAYLQITGEMIGDATSSLVIFESIDRGAELAWRISLPADEPMGDWEVIVNADDGRIIQVKDRMMYNTGNGLIWIPDPLTSANVEYGGAYVDNSDADSEQLNGQRVSIILRDIAFEGGVYKLKGPYAVLYDHERPNETFPELTDSSAFNYTRNEQGFEDVVCYYYVDYAGRRLVELGYNEPRQKEFHVDPHGMRGQDNSQYVSSSNYIAMGEGGVDDAEDSDAILHEYAHSFQTNLSGEMSYTGETMSLQEGCSDYWAASYSRYVNEYNWGYVFSWDGHNEFWDGRRCDLDWVYPEDYVTGHDGGQLWSSPLMKIWNDLGRDITDKLFIESHYIWGYSPTLPDAAQAFIQADRNLYNGEHLSIITKHFDFHGLVNTSDYLPAIEHTPLANTIETQTPYTVVAKITPGPEPLNLQKLWLVYGISALTDTVLLQPTGNPDQYSGQIPALGNGVDIYYYIAAVDSGNGKAYDPYNAPSVYHHFHAEAVGCIRGNVDLTDTDDDSGVQVFLSGIKSDTVVTGSDGNYEFTGLEGSEYSVKVFKMGYNTPDSIISGISVNQDTVSGINFILEPIVSALQNDPELIPRAHALYQNYPNPFNPVTNIRFGVAHAGMVKLELFNITGQLVSSLVEGQKEAGYYTFELKAARLASGIYFYRLEINDAEGHRFVKAHKMVLMK
jgi:hypothetical protein